MGTQGQDRDVVFLSGKRTPFGTFGGSLKDFTATELGTLSGKAALEASGVEASAVDHVFYGNAQQTSADAIYLARHVGLGVGCPREVPALTLNRLCGSGFQAMVTGAQDILLGQSRVTLCGGTESMSQAPHVVRGARWGDLRLGDAGDSFEDSLWQALLDSQCGLTMAQTAEELAERYGVTREEADEYALRSQQRAHRAWEEGRFADEVTPVTVRSRKGEKEFARDEHIRPDTSMEALSGLRPYFKKDGLVTAGNASGIGDGAASAVLADAEWAEAHGVEPSGPRPTGSSPSVAWSRGPSSGSSPRSWESGPRRPPGPPWSGRGSGSTRWTWWRSTRPSRRSTWPWRRSWSWTGRR